MSAAIIEFRPRERAERAPVHEFQLPAVVDRVPAAPRPARYGDGSPLHRRTMRWRKAQSYVEYLEHLQKAAMAAFGLFHHHGVKECKDLAEKDRLLEFDERIEAAKAALILTPIHQAPDLALKRKYLKRLDPKAHGLSPKKIEAAIAADESYLAIPPRLRPGALAAGKAVL
jgi:hypothetical protein